MTPIPPDVAATIVAAGHSLSADPVASGDVAWLWGSGVSIAPRWDVTVGAALAMYGVVRASATRLTPRAALLAALESLARKRLGRATEHRESALRRRDPQRRADDEALARTEEHHASDVRTLAAQVAAMWPEAAP